MIKSLYKAVRHTKSVLAVATIGLTVLTTTTKVLATEHSAYFQEVISGKVTDEKGIAIPGVSIRIKGTQTGATTDQTGSYSINTTTGSTLVFSFIGYENKEVIVTANQRINVQLIEQQNNLGEVVVVGYGTQKVEAVTSSIVRVKAEDFNQGGVKSPLDLIQGKVAGLTITRAGGNNNPNSNSSIQLRGVTTISGNNDPLIVIDGIPGGSLNLLQQDDIESFDVLKDGSAAAIYGTRGNAGVILITTKKGKAGDPRYDYSSYIAHDQVRKRPENLNANEFRALKADPENPSAGLMTDLGANEDYYDLLLNKKNLTSYHNLSASGGSEKTNYRASVFYSDNNGIAIQNGNKQYGGRINVNQRGLKDRLTLQMNMAANVRNINMNGGKSEDFEQAIQQNPTQPIFTPSGDYNIVTGVNYYNPIARLNQEKLNGERMLFSGDAKLSLDILPGLKGSVFGAIVRNSYTENEYRDRASKSSIDNYQGGGYAAKYSALTLTRTLESTVDYNKTFAGSHTINAVLGYSYQDEAYNNFKAINSGFLTDAFEENNLGAGTDLPLGRAGMSSTRNGSKLIAFFGRANYNYQEKYMASFILRREGSSRFGDNHKWGNFPAVSIGWNITKESFMESLPEISTLKLRAGFGITGSQDIPNYQSLVTLGTGGQYLNNGTWFQTYGPNRNPNPDLRWEKKKEFNIGLDFSIFNSRITGSLDVYNRKTVDLLANYNTQVPPFITPSLYTNVGSIQNNGIELALSALLLKKDNGLTWSVDFTANSQKNKLTSISNSVFKATELFYGSLPAPGSLGYAIRTIEGGPLGSFYGKRFAGFNDQGKWLFYKEDGSTGTASQMTTKDLAIIGNGVPKYMSSLGTTVNYKQFDFSIFFRGKFDYDILNLQNLYFGNKKWLGNNILKSALDEPKLNDDPQYSDYYLERGDFVKLDNITLGYNFKFKTTYVRSLRIYATGQNLAVITSYSGLDPELEDAGLTTGISSRGFYPQTRTFTFGLNVGF